MRIRTIKPEFWRSDDITSLSREDRLLFIGIWSYVDDNGVGIDDYRRIAADLFAFEDDQKEIREFVREGLATLSRRFLIARYELEGRCYIHVTSWRRHQKVDKPNKPRYPEPPADYKPPTSGNDDGSRESRDTFATPSPSVVRNRGTEEQRNNTSSRSASAKRTPDDRFAEFYAAYPRKRDPRKAEQAYRAALKRGATPDQLITAATAYARNGGETQFMKYPASWLNAEAYRNEPEQTRLSLVSAAPASFEALRDLADGQTASRLLGVPYVPTPQQPSDTTPTRVYDRDQALRFIDTHADALRAALAERRPA